MRYLKLSCLITLMLIFFGINIHAIEFKDGVFNCDETECKTTEKNYSFQDLTIQTCFKALNPEYIATVHFSYYVSIKIFKGDTKLWEYNEGLEAYGNSDVGIYKVSISPDKKAMAISVVGNSAYKIILIPPDYEVTVINGGSFTWEKNGKYLFTTIDEEIPIGFLIYDIYQKKIIFQTDKLIVDWRIGSDGKYILTEEPNLLEDHDQQDRVYYHIDLSDSAPKLSPIKIEEEK